MTRPDVAESGDASLRPDSDPDTAI